jgi:hypothetical protein
MHTYIHPDLYQISARMKSKPDLLQLDEVTRLLNQDGKVFHEKESSPSTGMPSCARVHPVKSEI